MKKYICVLVALLFLTSCAGLSGMREGSEECPPLLSPSVVEKAAAPAPAPIPPVVKLIPKFDPVYFDFDKSNLKPEEVGKLDKVADYALKNPNEKFLIEGNCDMKGPDDYNLKLGQKRADVAKNYLVKKGVDASRITTKSNGKLKALSIWTATDRRDDIFVK